MVNILKNIYHSYTTTPGYFLVTLIGIFLIIAGVCNIKLVLDIVCKWDLHFKSYKTKRIVCISLGIILILLMVLSAGKV